MSFTQTHVYEWLVAGISAVSFIIVMKLILLGPVKIPGLSNVAAMV